MNQTISGAVVQFKIENAKFQENFESINKRLDDFLVFGGMIITLLLAITVNVITAGKKKYAINANSR